MLSVTIVEFPAIAFCDPGHHKFRSCEQNKLSLCDVPLIIAQTCSSSSLSRARAREGFKLRCSCVNFTNRPSFPPPLAFCSSRHGNAVRKLRAVVCRQVIPFSSSLSWLRLCFPSSRMFPVSPLDSLLVDIIRHEVCSLGWIISFYNPVILARIRGTWVRLGTRDVSF